MPADNAAKDPVSSKEPVKLSQWEKISQFISKHDLKLCFLCYIVGVVWFLLLVHPEFNGHTYFSENALLPGLVETDFHHDHGASDYLRQLKDEVTKRKSNEDLRFKIPVQWLTRIMNEIGLDTYVQNYSFRYPNNVFMGKRFSGQNVYGILRAVRTSGTEALVLSSPFRPEPFSENTIPGIALMLGIAKSFRSHLYWAKDIIFLVTEDDEIGMQAWLSAYHHTYNDYIMAGELPGRSGAMQAALNLEIGTETLSRLDVRIEGLNGQLPNLDFVNTAVRLCKREGIMPTMQKRSDYNGDIRSFDGLIHSLKTLLLQMSHLATGSPTGNHGLFHRYNIEAITLRSIKLKTSRLSFSFTDVGRAIEGIFRSLNNLLERFHQSFFFYLLPSVERYISIGVYMPPIGIMGLPLVIKVLSLWLSRRHSSSLKETQSTDVKEGSVHADGNSSSDVDGVELNKTESLTGKVKSAGKTAVKIGSKPDGKDKSQHALESSSSFFSYFMCLLTSAFFGICAFYGPYTFITMSQNAHIESHTAMTMGIGVVHLLVVTSSFTMKRLVFSSSRYNANGPQKIDVRLVRCIALIMLGILLGTTVVVNVSLAFFVALVTVPVTVIVSPSHSRIVSVIKRLLLLIISPFSVICLASFASILLNQKATTVLNIHDALSEAWSNVQHGILLSNVQMEMFDNWTYGLVSLAYLTNWALFWQVMSCDPVS